MPVSHPNNMNTQQSPVAVVGLGLIGTSLAKRLLDAGFVVHGYDVDVARVANFEKLGGRPAATLRDVARAAQWEQGSHGGRINPSSRVRL